jgi:hypothetical protein
MVVTLAAVIGLVLFTVAALGHPFAGGARIGPGFFELVLERMDTTKWASPVRRTLYSAVHNGWPISPR